ncbi:MAG: DMT family transporter [Bosea sp. (in: a-proteobacteria)]
MTDSSLFLRAMPLVFVLIWSTGWVAAGYAAPYADPLTFLSVRFGCAAILVAAFCVFSGATWPTTWRGWFDVLLTGVLLHAIYLGSVWWAMRQGLPASISGLIAALQPILTALFAPWLLGERISLLRWGGILLGFLGIGLVLQPKLASVEPALLWTVALPILVNVVGMVSVTAGSFYQKTHLASVDLRSTTALQYVGALLVTLPVAFLLEPMKITWNTTTVLVLGWSVIALSLGAIGLMLLMIRRGAVSRVATLIYLIPPTVAFEAWLLFGEKLSLVQLAGMAVTVLGVALASRK